MAGSGKRIRWSRLVDRSTKRGIIVPLDHGLSYGPIPGLACVREVSTWIRHPAINSIIGHKGMIERLGDAGLLAGVGVIVHLNGMTATAEAPDTKRMLTAVRSAVRLGADAVSVQLNFAKDNHAHNIMLLGSVVDEAQEYGLPVLAMVYDRTPSAIDQDRIDHLRHLLRATYELGVDAIKIEAPETLAEVPHLLDGIAEDVAVFLAGSSLTSDERLLAISRSAVEAGGAGICVGRNVFQRTDPAGILDKLRETIVLVAKDRTHWMDAAVPMSSVQG